jgi:hypothetical protein
MTWLALAALWILTPSDPIDPPVAPAVPGRQGDQSPSIELWMDREGVFQPNDEIRVSFQTAFNAYTTVLRIDTDGRIQVLFPGSPWRNNWARAGREYEIKPGPARHTFLVDDYPGQGYVIAVASPTPFSFSGMVSGEEWDERSLGSEGWVEGDPYEALMNLVDVILPGGNGDYDYDILPYDVGETHEYPRFLCYDCHAHAAFPAWNPYESACTRMRLVIYDDPYYYPARESRSMRVVFTRPRRVEPRFVFEHRKPNLPYIEKANRRPVNDTGARRSVTDRITVKRHPDPVHLFR